MRVNVRFKLMGIRIHIVRSRSSKYVSIRKGY